MIQELKIRNFQSHRKSVLKFHEGVNVITGSSDCGKSAIIRALKWLVWNRPGGDAFRSNWGGDTNVSIKLDDGTKIYRSKGSVNLYEVNDTEFTAFGQDVPEEIQQLLNLTEVNIQQQLDSPFLLTETPGNVASHFSKVARIDKINATEKNINSEIRRLNSEIEKGKKDIEKFETELSEFPDLEKIEIELDVLEQVEGERNKIVTAKSTLSNLIRSIDTVSERIEEEAELLPFEIVVDSLIAKIEERDEIDSKCFQLATLQDDIEMLDHKAKKYRKIIGIEKTVNSLLLKITDKREIMRCQQLLQSQTYKLTTLNKKLLKTQENVLKLQQQFKQNFPNVCPLCGTPKKDIKL